MQESESYMSFDDSENLSHYHRVCSGLIWLAVECRFRSKQNRRGY
jgi:hypothetical protein